MIIEVREGQEGSLKFLQSSEVACNKGKIHFLPLDLLNVLREHRHNHLQITISNDDMNLVMRSFIPSDIPNQFCIAELTSESVEHFKKRMLKAFNKILCVAGFE